MVTGMAETEVTRKREENDFVNKTNKIQITSGSQIECYNFL